MLGVSTDIKLTDKKKIHVKYNTVTYLIYIFAYNIII